MRSLGVSALAVVMSGCLTYAANAGGDFTKEEFAVYGTVDLAVGVIAGVGGAYQSEPKKSVWKMIPLGIAGTVILDGLFALGLWGVDDHDGGPDL